MGSWRSFVALGDSFTEGMDDPHPEGSGYRGWADLVAGALANRLDRPTEFRYANLAVRGRLFDHVVGQQVPLAVAMRPDLISFAAGGNDALRGSFEPSRLVRRFDRTIQRLRDTGADVLVFRFADLTGRLPGGRLIRSRVELLNWAVEQTASRHGAHLVDLWHDPVLQDARMWSVDRLHLSTGGHRRVAAHVLRALGVDADPDWTQPLPPPEAMSFMTRRAADARWAKQHLAPWVRRRLTGRSSGDAVHPKRPDLTPLPDPQ